MNTLMSRKEAKNQGLRYFFTGKPCKRGHVSKRFVSSGSCAECNNQIYNRRIYNGIDRGYKSTPESIIDDKRRLLSLISKFEKEIEASLKINPLNINESLMARLTLILLQEKPTPAISDERQKRIDMLQDKVDKGFLSQEDFEEILADGFDEEMAVFSAAHFNWNNFEILPVEECGEWWANNKNSIICIDWEKVNER